MWYVPSMFCVSYPSQIISESYARGPHPFRLDLQLEVVCEDVDRKSHLIVLHIFLIRVNSRFFS